VIQTAGDVGFGVGVGIFIFVWLVVVIGSLVMLVVALVDIVRRPDWEWKLAGQEKVLWILLIVLINFLAIPSLIYWFNIRKKLIAVREAAQRGAYGPGHMTYAGWEPGFAPVSYQSSPPAGWYPDPITPGQFRWWDGTRWMEHTWRDPASTPEQATPT
jgi:Protein of unknown function (DUF2510)